MTDEQLHNALFVRVTEAAEAHTVERLTEAGQDPRVVKFGMHQNEFKLATKTIMEHIWPLIEEALENKFIEGQHTVWESLE